MKQTASLARVLDRDLSVCERERKRRQLLGEFLRRVEPTVHGASGGVREELRTLLGWDDASLHAFVEADVVVHSSPHASMNAFEPMFAFPWLAAKLASCSPMPARAVHLRTVVTHNNLGDLRWRPYAWWHRTRDRSVVKTRMFTRNSKLRHHVLLAKPVPRLDLSDCVSMDREAIALAGHTCNYAYFCMVYRSFVERCAGLHGLPPMVEVPIDLLNAFSLHEDGIELWASALAHFGMSFRTTDAAGRLVEVAPPGRGQEGEGTGGTATVRGENAKRAGAKVDVEVAEATTQLSTARPRPLLCPNAINLAQAQLFGLSFMIGAERMSEYVPRTADMIGRVVERLGFPNRPPRFVGVTDVPIAEVLEHDPATRACFAVDGLLGSLPVGAADIGGRVAANLERLFSTDSSRFAEAPPFAETAAAQ
jgi:hypothetical protein